ncbi:MAG: malonic semialdehyde reductase [Paludibacterium sp.]|uniref:malonic semialdehyde reductase n=1 Tax=Paludibacterium sp. TaxID=1917523 RepID=UPI0025FA422F|nr:malonic semialdehyde reductase [Paludibacterium sp.]MBV8049203.1 malonic semialdehyde reductase [Paludibacterium sp.]MBV8647256.1 malonic semialdehyde reductase [Paludibacterium sp.]
MTTPIGKSALDQLFYNARTHSHWQKRPVPEALLHQLFELLKQCPTSANCSPARFVFITSTDAKARLLPCLAEGNVEKTREAPVTVIVGMDLAFHQHLPRLFPHADAQSWFNGHDELIKSTAFRNSALQGAYLILAARALGLDCGPMSGFDAALIDAAFFPQGNVRTNFLINLGYGEASKLYGRSPRFDFDEVCQIL